MNLEKLCGFENFCLYSCPDGGPMGGSSSSSPVTLKIEFNDGSNQTAHVAVPEGQANNIVRVTVVDRKP